MTIPVRFDPVLDVRNNQLEAYAVKTDSAGNVNNCGDIQSTAATTGSASLAASSAKLSITVPSKGALAGQAAASSTSLRNCA
jgi:hypothetical protein